MPLFCVCFCLKVSYQTYGAPSVVQLVKNPPDSAEDTRDMGSIPGPGGSPRAENGNPIQCFLPGKFHGRGAWWATVYGVAKS